MEMEGYTEAEKTALIVTDTPPQNQSLLRNVLGSCSGESLPIIFKNLSSLKDKVRLERVCRIFKKHALSFEAWSNIECLSIEDCHNHENYLLNNDLIPLRFVFQSIHSVVSRSLNLREIQFLCQTDPEASKSAVEALQERGGAITYRKLQQFNTNALFTPENFLQIVTLVDAFKSQLTTLHIAYVQNLKKFGEVTEGYTERFWKLIGECVNLTSISYHGNRDELSSAPMVKTALSGKAIQYLELRGWWIVEDDFIEIVSSFVDHSLRTLVSYGKNMGGISLAEVVERISSAAPRNSLEDFSYAHGEQLPNTDPTWSAILRLPALFPQLKKVLLDNTLFEANQAADLIMAYFEILINDCIARCLTVTLRYCLSDAKWKEIIELLTMQQKCEVLLSTEDDSSHVCVRLGQSCIRLILSGKYSI